MPDADFSAVRDVFLRDAPRRVAILEEGLSGLGPEDGHAMDALAFTAHTLRGAAATAGQHTAAEAAALLETALRTGDVDGARGAVSRVRAALEPRVVVHVEDDATNAALVERIMQRRPHLRLVTASSGMAALAMVERERPLLVVLDLHLADMAGEQVLQHLRSNAVTADVPVIVVSGEARPSEVERVRNAGVYRYLTKPVDVGLFLSLLDEIAPPGAASGVAGAPNDDSTPHGVYRLRSKNGRLDPLDDERLRLALAAGGLDLWAWDVSSGRFAWRGLVDLGLSADHLGTTQQAIANRIHPEDLAGMFKRMERTLVDGSDFVAEFRFSLPNGNLRWLSMRGAPETYDGRPVRVVGVIADVTERKLAELDTQRVNLALEESVQERTKQLQDSTAESVRANAAKSTFLAHLSHELRTPLNSLTGFAQLLELDPMTGDQKEAVERILAASRHMLFLIDDLLDIARIEMEDVALSPERLDVHAVVAEACQLVAPLAVAHHVVVTTVEDAHLAVYADRGRLLEILINLITNGIRYNRPGGSVTVASTAHPNMIRIEVRDTGRGIAESDIERLFWPFERLDPEHAHGTGLGLTLAKSLVEAMGGSIRVESRVDEGSVFSVQLPEAV